MTLLGTRPEIIRLALIITKLDDLCEHVLVHTGQNFDAGLSDIFFDQLGIRQPNHLMKIRGNSFGEQIGGIIASAEQLLRSEKAGRLLVLGDTNSALSAIAAKRLSIPVFHMEAGNRCYDDRVPEEVNRRMIDHCSDILLPYTERSRKNLLKEGIPGDRIYVTGNPIYEVVQHYKPRIQESTILDELGLEPERYFLVTMHRAENVDIESRLLSLTAALNRLQDKYDLPVIVSTHPRTRDRMKLLRVHEENNKVQFLRPFGFFDFIALEQNAFCVLSDSGTVQEECCIFRIPNVTIRDVTERPETIECGSNILSGVESESILECVEVALSQKCSWHIPVEYLQQHVSSTIVKIVLGHKWR